MHTGKITILLFVVFLLVACSSAEPTATPQPSATPTATATEMPTETPQPTATPEPTAIPSTPTPDLSGLPDDLPDYGLEMFSYTQTIEGVYEGTEYVSGSFGGGIPAEYGPSASGGTTVRDGHTALGVRTTVKGGDSESNRNARIIFHIMEDTEPGTYELVEWFDVTDDNPIGAGGTITNAGSFNAIGGTFTLDYLDAQFISGSYEATLMNGDDEEINVSGSVYLIEYTPAMDFSLTMTGAYEMTGMPGMRITHSRQGGNAPDSSFRRIELGLRTGDDAEEEINTRIKIEVAPANAITAGETYDVTLEDTPVVVTVTVDGEAVSITAGTITFDETLYSWAGSLELTIETGAGEAVITGTFSDIIWNLSP